MCDPITIGSLVLSTAGAVGTAKTNKNYVNAQNQANKSAFDISQQAREAEITRQKGFQDEAETTYRGTEDAVTRENYDTERNTAADDFISALSTRPDALNQPALTSTASADVRQDAARRTNEAASKSRERIAALANLSSYATTSGNRALTFGNSADALSTIGGLRRGSLGVGNQEQNIAPAQVTRGDNMLADLLGGAGSFLGMAGPGLFGGSMGGSALAPSSSLRPPMRVM